MLPEDLHGTLELWNGESVTFTAHITAEVDEDCRIYRADLPMFLDAQGTPLLLRRARLDVLPAHSKLVLGFDPELPPKHVI